MYIHIRVCLAQPAAGGDRPGEGLTRDMLYYVMIYYVIVCYIIVYVI